MKRFYFVSDNLNEIQLAEQDLLAAGYEMAQVHVLSQLESEVEKRHLHDVHPFARLDVLKSAARGATVGLFLAVIVLIAGAWLEPQSATDWLLFIFLAAVLFFFSIWEGGLYGFQVQSPELRRFRKLLLRGYHVLIVDARKQNENSLQHILSFRESIFQAGLGSARPEWMLSTEKSFRAFVNAMP